MKYCYECGKKVSFFNSYYHPAIGEKAIVCSKCFDRIEESMEKYCDFILSESIDKEQEQSWNIASIKLKILNWWNHIKIAH